MATDFSRTLSLLRQETGVSQRKAAAALGVSQALLSHYENGIREPGLAFVSRVCDYYHVSADFLLGRSSSRDGSIIDAAELYDASDEKGTLKGSILATLQKKLAVNTTGVLFDLLGRCGPAEACVGQELMPTEERGAIGMVKPSGWHTVRYDGVVDGKYLYNRCHLIGYQLTGENANERNLITGTRYLNVEGMLPFENQVADYVEETGNHVLYRSTPVFKGLELVARGVQIEAWSVEDGGAGVCFNVYCYNVQPGVEIDYATGESCLAEENAA